GLAEVARRNQGADTLALCERKEVDKGSALRLAAPERKLVDLQAVDLPGRREEQQVVVRGGDDEMLDVVLVFQLHAHDADAAAALLAVRGHWQALHVARARDRDDHVL